MNKELQLIAEAVAEIYGIPVFRLGAKSRKQNLVDARITFALIATRMGYRPETIGTAINRDRSTPYHYLEVGSHRLEYERVFAARARESFRIFLSRRRNERASVMRPAVVDGRVAVCG